MYNIIIVSMISADNFFLNIDTISQKEEKILSNDTDIKVMTVTWGNAQMNIQ